MVTILCWEKSNHLVLERALMVYRPGNERFGMCACQAGIQCSRQVQMTGQQLLLGVLVNLIQPIVSNVHCTVTASFNR